MPRRLNQLRQAVFGAFGHGVAMNSKGAAYSLMLTIFPAFIVFSWVLGATHTTQTFIQEISIALGTVLPPGSRTTALAYFIGPERPVREFVSAGTATIFAASGVMISWMTGFREAYGIHENPWGFWHERAIALLLVFFGFAPMIFAMMLVAFGNQIEAWVVLHLVWVPRFTVLLLFSLVRWIISFLTSVTVIMLIYHWGLPRIQPWHRVLPGAIAATFLWFPVTIIFGWYVTNLSTYNIIYGSLGAGIALLVWMYLISITILIGAEFNAVVCPRTVAPIQEERRRPDRRKGPRRATERA
jgi:membrane protein